MKDHMDSIEPLKAYYDYRGDALSGTAPILEYTEWLEQRYAELSAMSEENAKLREVNGHIAVQRFANYKETLRLRGVEVDLREALNRCAALEKAEAVWIREAQLLREALDKSNDAVIEAEAKAEKYYRKVRELEIALRLNCKMEPPTASDILDKVACDLQQGQNIFRAESVKKLLFRGDALRSENNTLKAENEELHNIINRAADIEDQEVLE